ncbi:MAG: hypothetical protein OCD01_03860 [Fibrobacterales bacterium]
MKQSMITFIASAMALLLWHCTLSETSGTASGAENAIAGVVYYPDSSVAAGVPVALRQGSINPNTETIVFKDTTNVRGEFSFVHSMDSGVIVVAHEYQSEVVGERVAVSLDDESIVINLKETYDFSIVVPVYFDTVQLWVEGDSIAVQGFAGDTLLLPSIPIGKRTLYIEQDSLIITDTIVIPDERAVNIPVESSSAKNTLSSSTQLAAVVELSSTQDPVVVELSSSSVTVDTVPVSNAGSDTSWYFSHEIDSTNPLTFSVESFHFAINNISERVYPTFAKAPDHYDHLIWETLDPEVFHIKGDTFVFNDFGVGRLRMVDTVEWREGILPIHVDFYFDDRGTNATFTLGDDSLDVYTQLLSGRANSDNEGTIYTTVLLDGIRIMRENLIMITDSGSSCYDEDDENCETYGRLYNWEQAKKSCPDGWRIPMNSEWSRIGKYITQQESLNAGLWGIWPVGKQMMQDTLGLWLDSMDIALDLPGDRHGFSAVPAGYFDATTQTYRDLQHGTVFWSIDDESPEDRTTITWSLHSDSQNFIRSGIESLRPYNGQTSETTLTEFPDLSQNYYSVRCIRDQ